MNEKDINICTKCKGDKNINGFVKNKSICKKCKSVNNKEYREKNKEKISEKAKAKYEETHPKQPDVDPNICTICKGDKNIIGFVAKRTICKNCKHDEEHKYNTKNKEKLVEYHKIYYETNRPEKNVKMDENSNICTNCNGDKNINGFAPHRKICKLCVNQKCKDYKKNNPAIISAYNKKYKSDHADEIAIYNAKYFDEHRDEIINRHNLRMKERKKIDPQYKLFCTTRLRILGAFNKANNKNTSDTKLIKHSKTIELLGCSIEFFIDWMKFQFEDGMTLENHGSVWHIDHIIPCTAFDIGKQDDIEKCFNWKNTQPLFVSENLKKNNKIYDEHIERNKKRITEFLKIQEAKNHHKKF
jgi:hypothetical protein